MKNNALEDRLLTVKEAALYLGFAEGTIRNKVSKNEIPYVKLGKALRFRKSELDRWIIEKHASTEDTDSGKGSKAA